VLKNKLNNNQITIGSWITLGHPAVAEILAKAGFDWLVIDLEHSTISIEQAGDLIRIIDLSGVTPLVRLTSNDSNQIKRVMDAGAHGIVVPMVNSKVDAENAVASTRYAPEGVRGVGLARAQSYGAGFQDYLEWQKNGPIVVVQIEHQSALENLEDILSVSGVDGYIVGPYDLSCSLGFPGDFTHPDFIAAMKLINTAGQLLRKSGGLHIVEPDINKLNEAIEFGHKFIAYSVDIRMLDVSARDAINKVKRKK
jgi:2-keto-3-deoxy-L-rhamnonate aldolase RhmA